MEIHVDYAAAYAAAADETRRMPPGIARAAAQAELRGRLLAGEFGGHLEVRAHGNGAGAASFRLASAARKKGLVAQPANTGAGPSFSYGYRVAVASLEEALGLVDAVGGPGVVGAIFGAHESCRICWAWGAQ